MPYTVKDLVTGSLQEIRAIQGGDVPSADDLVLGTTLFNELLDSLNGDARAVYSLVFTTYTLTPSLQPHTIGVSTNSPAPKFNVTGNRPETIASANIVIPTNVRIPLNIVDHQAWNDIRAGAAAGQAVTITSSVPTTLYYAEDWPNGSIYLWPVPSAAYGLELAMRVVLASMLATDTLSLPPGYREMLRLTLAEKMAPAFDVDVPPQTTVMAREARARVWANNDEVPRLINDGAALSDATGSARSNWNRYTGNF